MAHPSAAAPGAIAQEPARAEAGEGAEGQATDMMGRRELPAASGDEHDAFVKAPLKAFDRAGVRRRAKRSFARRMRRACREACSIEAVAIACRDDELGPLEELDWEIALDHDDLVDAREAYAGWVEAWDQAEFDRATLVRLLGLLQENAA